MQRREAIKSTTKRRVLKWLGISLILCIVSAAPIEVVLERFYKEERMPSAVEESLSLYYAPVQLLYDHVPLFQKSYEWQRDKLRKLF